LMCASSIEKPIKQTLIFQCCLMGFRSALAYRAKFYTIITHLTKYQQTNNFNIFFGRNDITMQQPIRIYDLLLNCNYWNSHVFTRIQKLFNDSDKIKKCFNCILKILLKCPSKKHHGVFLISEVRKKRS